MCENSQDNAVQIYVFFSFFYKFISDYKIADSNTHLTHKLLKNNQLIIMEFPVLKG